MLFGSSADWCFFRELVPGSFFRKSTALGAPYLASNSPHPACFAHLLISQRLLETQAGARLRNHSSASPPGSTFPSQDTRISPKNPNLSVFLRPLPFRVAALLLLLLLFASISLHLHLVVRRGAHIYGTNPLWSDALGACCIGLTYAKRTKLQKLNYFLLIESRYAATVVSHRSGF